jgi:hypothetical protein
VTYLLLLHHLSFFPGKTCGSSLKTPREDKRGADPTYVGDAVNVNVNIDDVCTSTLSTLDIEMHRVKGTLRGLDPTQLRV